MTFYPVVRTQGAVFTIEAQFDITLDHVGMPVDDESNVMLFLTVSPPIEAAEIFESQLPDMPDFDLLVKTPNTCLYIQMLDAEWSVSMAVKYLQDCIPKMVRYLDSIETGTYFNQMQ